MAQDPDIRLLTSPRIFLVGMAAFLALVGFVVLILYQADRARLQRQSGPERPHPRRSGDRLAVHLPAGDPAFSRNPLGQFADRRADRRRRRRLGCSRRWRRCSTPGRARAACRPSRPAPFSIPSPPGSTRDANSAATWSAFWCSSACSARSGACWRRCIRSAGVIDSMKTGADTATMFDDLKTGLSAPIAGMSVSFTSSLFGLASSLILGFLDLQAGQAQNRFYSEFEEFLASHVQTDPARSRRCRGADHRPRRATGDRASARRQGDRDARRRHPGAGQPHAHRAAADSRLGRRAGGAAGGHRQAPAPPARRTGNAVSALLGASGAVVLVLEDVGTPGRLGERG